MGVAVADSDVGGLLPALLTFPLSATAGSIALATAGSIVLAQLRFSQQTMG